MKQKFINRVMREGIVDTENYRYIATEEYDAKTQWIEIKRLPIDQLDTTTAIDGWQIVKRIY